MESTVAIQERVVSYRNYTAECLLEMVKIPSVSCEEKQIVLKIKELLENAGIAEVRIDGLGNLGQGPKILAIDGSH
jgi:putative aminopeptidase FrvX